MLFELKQFTLQKGKQRVLDDLSISIRAGEKVALLGPSGAGKTSLLRTLYPQQAGHCALQPQHGGLVELLSVYHNIFMGALDRVNTPAALWNLVRPLAAHRDAVSHLAEQLGLAEKLWQSPDRLSGGQRQRVALGRALYRRKPVFLGDEPVSAVDPLHAEALLRQVLQQHDTALVSLHNRRLALHCFDRIVVMKQGRIVCDQPAASLSSADLDPFYRSGGQSMDSPL